MSSKCLRMIGVVITALCLAVSVKSEASRIKSIVKVQEISVSAPVGTAPRLPYRIVVTYSDGTTGFRQVRWMNSGVATERMEASDDPSINPVGSRYTVKGFILGDNTTASGYPVSASVTVVPDPWEVPSSKPVAEPLPLNKVHLTGDNRLTSNRDLDVREMLNHWDVAQQLYNYRDTYGLSTEGYPVSDGWDSPTTKLKGHGSGHYMSALSFAYAGCTDPALKIQLLSRIRRMVDELRECQERTFVWHPELGRYWEARDYAPEEELKEMKGSWADFDNYKKDYAKYGYGYINAIPAAHCVLIEMYRPYNNENWVWAPYYSVHKQLAGLIDIATYVDDPKISGKALLIAKDMGLWVWNRLHYRTYVQKEGTVEERREKPGNRFEMWNMYIAGEVGGMAESLSRLSEMVGDRTEKARLLEAANCFDSPAFFDPLSNNVDDIRTRHANQHIPMIVGALRSYRSNGDPYYYNIAENFWSFIQGRYRYAMGGVGDGEMFREPYSQITSMTNASRRDYRTGQLLPMSEINETCCAYNLAKLSKDLNCFNPDDARYMDYYERVLYNQIVGSIHPHEYKTTYQYAVGINASKPWGNASPQESCCGGTGSENHVKYQEAAYFVSDNTIWIALYLPSVATWDQKKVSFEQECRWPAERSTIRVTEGKGRFSMKLRVPYWAAGNFDIRINGKSLASGYTPGSYFEIPRRKWKKGDVVEILMPFTKHIDFGPDKMETAVKPEGKVDVDPMWLGTIMYGPLAMTTVGIEDWDDATVNMNYDMSDVILNGPGEGQGTDGNLYTLEFNGRTFIPDYYADTCETHYLRINLIADPSAKYKVALNTLMDKAGKYDEANYSPESFKRLTDEIARTRALFEGGTIDEAEADARIDAVGKAFDALRPVKLDKGPIVLTIAKAESIESGLYTSDSFDSMRKALAEAKDAVRSAETQNAYDLADYLLSTAIADLVPASSVDKSRLKEQMDIARARRDAQNAWNSLSVKVPEWAPWAPNAYARMIDGYDKSNEILNNTGKNFSQAEIDKAAAELKSLINAMRPGNLPEMEDLAELNELLAKAREVNDRSGKYRDAMSYARMVVNYVSDGSGTRDMIEKAVAGIRDILD